MKVAYQNIIGILKQKCLTVLILLLTNHSFKNLNIVKILYINALPYTKKCFHSLRYRKSKNLFFGEGLKLKKKILFTLDETDQKTKYKNLHYLCGFCALFQL